MSRMLRLALLADGSSDRALLPIIRWVVTQADPELEILQPGFRVRAMRSDLLAEMAATCQEFEPDILFVHRDAEAIRDFAPLRRLSAFARFERECGEACREVAGGR